MFDNIGGKIKISAIACAALGTLVFCVWGINIMVSDEERVIYGVILMVVGALLSWIGSFVLYGFGELIESVKRIAESTATPKEEKEREARKDEEAQIFDLINKLQANNESCDENNCEKRDT